MFYSDVILAKRGPLARVWLAAHWERKLSKTQFLQTSIEKSVSAIMGQEVVPMALRLSGQLLLGVVRIYSRKAKYLLEDCNEALLKIKMAFRSGAVDMTSDQLNISRNAITLPDIRTDLDILLPDQAMSDLDVDFERLAAKKAKKLADNPTAYTARAADITLPTVDYSAFDDTFDVSSGIDGIASQDFDPDGGLDLGLEDDFPEVEGRRNEAGQLVDENGDPLPEDDSLSIGVGRDAPSEAGRQSVASMLNLGMDNDITLGSAGGSQAPSIGVPEFDLGGEGLDLGLDNEGLDLGLDAPMDLDRAVTPPGDNSMALAMADMTPTTAARIRDAAQQRQQDEAATRQAKARKQIVDALTELPESQLGGLSQGLSQGGASQSANLADILTEERYLPRSRAYLRLLSIREDPFAHFMPFADPSNKDKSSLFIGPNGLASELSELFTFDLGAMRRRRAAALTDEEGPNKRARLGADDEDDFEMGTGRRAQQGRESLGFGDMAADQPGFDFSMGGDGGLDIPGMDTSMGLDLGDDGLRRSSRRSRAELEAEEANETGRLPALSRLSTPDIDDGGLDSLAVSSSNPLAVFDTRPADETQSAAHEEAASVLRASEDAEASTQGWAKSTVRALRIVRSQLSPSAAATEEEPSQSRFVEVDEETEEKKLSFQKISNNASRRAAAGFFFEMLVLGTKDCVKLQQDEAYGDIKVTAKEKLWNANTVASQVATAPVEGATTALQADA
ncbi:hypothetical protein NDA16_000323 [Ustilago loliicola]|nr:hypothetical protein NDA16_000323 [Ustilago loliicola]